MSWVRPAKLCSRCGGHWRFGFNWPEGYVCRSCVTRHLGVHGRCPGCATERLLVGREGEARAACVDCAGITTSFVCRRCGHEGRTWYSHTCMACSLEIRARLVLDDRTGRVAPATGPLYSHRTRERDPDATLGWIVKAPGSARLSSLARGEVPLTHEGIDQMAAGQGREYLRELLVAVGLIGYRDKYLAAFGAWQPGRLASIEEPDIRREIRLYLAWRHQRDLAVRAAAGRVSATAANLARDKTDGAVRFLRFVSARGHGLSELSQDDVDAFFADATNPDIASDFLALAVEHRRYSEVAAPRRQRRLSPEAPLQRLQAIVRRLIEDEALALADCVAGLLVLLFAQPVTRVAALRLDELTVTSTEVVVDLGPDPVALPPPAAELVRRYLDRRAQLPASRATTPHLFPGNRPGTHITAFQLTKHLNGLGITAFERQRALTHLVSEAPAAVVARATGYSLGATARRAAVSGAD